MTIPNFAAIEIGDPIPTITTDPITRTILALYCGASGDHNPLHVDIDFAKKAGLDDVIAHGMLSMAYLGRAITDWVPLERMRGYSVRFSAMTEVRDAITCSGRIAEKFTVDGENRVRIEVNAQTQTGKTTLQGEVVVAL